MDLFIYLVFSIKIDLFFDPFCKQRNIIKREMRSNFVHKMRKSNNKSVVTCWFSWKTDVSISLKITCIHKDTKKPIEGEQGGVNPVFGKMLLQLG